MTDDDLALSDPASRELHARLGATMAASMRLLPDKPEETAESTLRCLWHLAAQHPLSHEASGRVPLEPLSAAMRQRLEELAQQRISGVPLAHLTGRQHFMGLEFLTSPQAMIPRRETEILARSAIDRLTAQVLPAHGRAVVIDACTGCGNVVASMAHADPRITGFASDLSGDAVELARQNIAQLGLAERVELRTGDLLKPFDEPRFQQSIDLITCNPPYISTGKVGTMSSDIVGFEPHLAFDGGALGVRILQRLIKEAPPLLRAGGWLLFEVGLGQGPSIIRRMELSGLYRHVEGVADDEGHIRTVIARRT